MKIILLSGGSGNRLWPLSNDSVPKQFLELIKKENTAVSLIQEKWEKIKIYGLENETIIATSIFQEELIRKNLGSNVMSVIEPEQKDTYGAILLSTLFLYDELGVNPEEVVIVLPVDSFTDSSFFESVIKLQYIFQNDLPCSVGLLGVKPTEVESKYGYILLGDQYDSGSYQVKKFIEKPNKDKAKIFIDQGALWNSGVFAFKISYILDNLRKNGYSLNYNLFRKNYGLLPNSSFDKEVLENANNILINKYDGLWNDIGTWNSLTQHLESNIYGQGFISECCTNSHLINKLKIPVYVFGLSDVIVVITENGILISNKEDSDQIKNYKHIKLNNNKQSLLLKLNNE